jgi:hypothetical protein
MSAMQPSLAQSTLIAAVGLMWHDRSGSFAAVVNRLRRAS